MEQEFRLLPVQAATRSPHVDALYYALSGVALFFTGLICFLILFFIVRYRKNSPYNRKGEIGYKGQLGIELTWSIIPLLIAMSAFAWGARLYFEQFHPPADALEVYVVGKQWMWKIQHAEGRREINHLHVPRGRPVVLKMISEDVIHSFYLPAFRTKMDVLPGRYTSLWFEASRTGEYHLFCAEYCGTSHASMRGSVHVMEPEDYADWLEAEERESPAESGRRLLDKYGCTECHNTEPPAAAPPLENLFGRVRPLADGGTVRADEAYIRESILSPGAHVVRGYEVQGGGTLMPTFQDQISEEEILQIIAYLKSTSAEDANETQQEQP